MDQFDSSYDENTTIFSPDGRLFQVEYARETIKKGATTIGLKFKNGVILIAYKKDFSRLTESQSLDKIFQIDNNIICSYIGLQADAKHLIELSLEEAALYKLGYDEQIQVKTLVENICEYKHIFTIYDVLRPFGVVLFIAGLDAKGVHLFSTDPSGVFLEHKAVCEGEKSNSVINYLIKNYKENLSCNNAIKLGLDALKNSFKRKLYPKNIEIGVIKKNKVFYKISKKQLKIFEDGTKNDKK